MIAVERSLSRIVGVSTPHWTTLIYLAYGSAMMALPVAILADLLIRRRWKVLEAYVAAGLVAIVALSFWEIGFTGPRWRLNMVDRLDSVWSQFLADRRLARCWGSRSAGSSAP